MKTLQKIALSALSLSALVGCGGTGTQGSDTSANHSKYGDNYDPKNAIVDKQFIMGMGDLSWSECSWTNTDWKKTHSLIKNLGVKSVRVWLHSNWIMSNPTTYNKKGLALGRGIVESHLANHMQIIGMNHSNFHKGGFKNSSSTTAKPSRDLSEGSYYLTWLEDYRTTWYNLVKAFPEISYWEIDNEDNNDVFFGRLEGGNFSLKEKADIYTDMLYYASKGIHEANPNALTVLGGMVLSGAETFLQYIYDNIASGDFGSVYPDDYFQVANWHPYMDNFNKKLFLETNNGIYDIIKKNEKKDKKVFFTEMGFSTGNVSLKRITEFIPQLYQIAKEDLPYLESVHYFRMYDALDSTWGSSAEKGYGLFSDPNSHGVENENPLLASPKTSAYAYQEAAKGEGSLTIYQEAVNP